MDAVPVELRILRAQRLVTVTAQDRLVAADVERIFRQLVAKHVMAYGKLFDLRSTTVELSSANLLRHAGMLSVHTSRHQVGALALVVNETTRIEASVLASLAVADRPLRLFQDVVEAADWLRKYDLGRRNSAGR
jgi:hypothetical protein